MKGERVAQLELLLRSHPEGLRRAEIARRIGVHRSTVSRYVDNLKQFIDVYEDNNLIKIRNKEETDPVELSVYESLALNMGAEILMEKTGFQSPHLASGLRKIAMNMRSYAPKISEEMVKMAEKVEKEEKKNQTTGPYAQILEVLIDAWVSGRMVKIQHKNLSSQLEETEFAPYFIGFIEDDSDRNPISVTGRLRHTTEMVTINITNIKSAVILNQTYTIPDNLKPFKRPEHGNGYNSIDMIHLVLKLKEKSAFNSFVKLNYENPKFEKQNDGHYICQMNIENSIELLLRIIQCGDSVEIINPEKYRSKFINYVKNILKVYEK